MGLESGTYLNDLVTTNPTATDPKSQGDDHIRLIKACAKDTFPGFAGIVMGTATESGSSNAYALTLSPVPSDYAHLVGSLLLFKATHANTGAATLNVNALGTKPIVAVDGSALESGDIENGAMVAVFYDGTSMCLISANDRAARAGDTYTGTHDFTGATPEVPTQSAGDNSTKAASTAYVDAADALKANLASPTFTGTPAAPTAAGGTNTTQVATTAFVVQQAFSAALPAQTTPALLFTNGSSASWAATLSGNSGKFLTSDGTGVSWANVPIAPDVIMRASSGVSLTAGSFTNTTINTTDRNQGSLATLASSQITLPAGTYYAKAKASVDISAGGVNHSGVTQARLFNATDSAVVGSAGMGVQMTIGDGDGGAVPEVVVVFTLAGSKAINLQALGPSATSSTTTACFVEIWKIG